MGSAPLLSILGAKYGQTRTKTRTRGSRPMDRFLKFLGGLAIVLLTVPLWGVVIQDLWGWFITPAFGITPPSIWICVGLQASAGVFLTSTLQGLSTIKEKLGCKTDMAELLVQSVLSPLFAWGIGGIIHLIAGWAA